MRRPDRDVPFRSTGCLTKHGLQFHSMDMNGAILISELLMEEANESNNGSTASNGQVAGAGTEVEGDGDGESHSHTCVSGALVVAGGCGRRRSPCFSCPR